ncbi:DUF4123 domain-containing protein [Oceanimonas baumannii]|uniref:DUF4123 domain-containing protein n=1 Tax=Oceanimonas baumannii TaxID=129578 RepID=UPI001D195DEA|nr:DUF4123 domain-containing protein [Oceanimonas baumannii]MCC4265889.1 DUF4123 domain-containing protein [Oceanimonas baumannii]
MIEISAFAGDQKPGFEQDSHLHTALLLDGATRQNLLTLIYEQQSAPEFELLYLNSELDELCDISPCLVAVSTDDDLFARFCEQGISGEWGYMLCFSAPWHEVTAHLRRLMKVIHPSGEEVYLKLAAPSVMAAMLQNELRRPALMGPISEIITIDSYAGELSRFVNEAPFFNDDDTLLRLTEEDMVLLSEADFRRVCIGLMTHMQRYFPEWCNRPEDGQTSCWKRVLSIAELAYEQGFQSERDITMFANILGYLNTDSIDQAEYSNIHQLLYADSETVASQRLSIAAQYAQQTSGQLQRENHVQ